MATHIKTDGTETTVAPRSGQYFTLEELQEFVGGYPERFRTRDRRWMYVNEEGLLLELPPNPRATALIGAWIVGDVVILSQEEEEPDE